MTYYRFLNVSLGVFCMVSLLTGCASITGGHNQSVSVTTGKVEGASCTLVNDKGTWYVPMTPGSVTVHRAYGDLAVTCKKDHQLGTTTVESSTKALAFGNAIFGGVVGAVVDTSTGAAYDYPSEIVVDLKDPRELGVQQPDSSLKPAEATVEAENTRTKEPEETDVS